MPIPQGEIPTESHEPSFRSSCVCQAGQESVEDDADQGSKWFKLPVTSGGKLTKKNPYYHENDDDDDDDGDGDGDGFFT